MPRKSGATVWRSTVPQGGLAIIADTMYDR